MEAGAVPQVPFMFAGTKKLKSGRMVVFVATASKGDPMRKRWSKYDKEQYSIEINGGFYGIGLLPIWDQVPGSWNILALLWGEGLENLIRWEGDPYMFPQTGNLVGYAVGFALQRFAEGVSWGDLAENLTPRQFMERIIEYPNKKELIPVALWGTDFQIRAQKHAKDYIDHNSNVVRVNFGRG